MRFQPSGTSIPSLLFGTNTVGEPILLDLGLSLSSSTFFLNRLRESVEIQLTKLLQYNL